MKIASIRTLKHNLGEETTRFEFTNYNNPIFRNAKKNQELHISKAIDKAEIKIGLEFEFYIKEDKKLEDFIFSLGNFVEVLDFKPKEYNTQDKDLNAWTIERDGTLSPIREGFELVSPKLDLIESKYIINSVLNLLQRYAITDESCGMHFHISSESKMLEKLDATKLMLFLDNKDTLKKWENRSSCNIELMDLFKKTKMSVFSKNFDNLSRFYTIASRRNYGIQNHLEVRSIGGKDYQHKEDLILKDFESFVDAYYIGCNPLYEHELYKELMKDFLEEHQHELKDAVNLEDIIESAKHLANENNLDYENLNNLDLKELLETVVFNTEDLREKLVPVRPLLEEIEDYTAGVVV